MFAETTNSSTRERILDDAIRALKVTGTLLLRESYAGPWAVSIPGRNELNTILKLPRNTYAIAFHLVEYGHCEIRLDQSESVLLKAGDMAVCFGGAPHRLAVGQRGAAQPIAALLGGKRNERRPEIVGRSADTSLICGVFLLQYPDFNPLLAALPPVLHASLAQSGELHNLSGVARLIANEIARSSAGSTYVVERLVEVLCAEAIRACVDAAPSHVMSWLRAIKDPIVGRAIAAVHASPGDDWSVNRLASEVSMSPSRFAARFSESLGLSPMSYVTRWRMNVACRALDESRISVDQIATTVGYESPAAFNRTFKKLVGLPPATWRARAER